MASHIVGGELTYQYLGNDVYQIRLKVYRDCFNGIPPFDNPASLLFFDQNNVLLYYSLIRNPVVKELPLVSTDPCLGTPSGVCVEEAIYTNNIRLPYRVGGYQIAYQRCCRNKTILNILNPSEVGATYMTVIPDNKLITNSSPFFNNFPPIYICNNSPLNFDHSATDPDGDSLSYELCDPFVGGDTTKPFNAIYPDGFFYLTDNANPPYDFVTFRPPFTGANPLSGVPLKINPQTGLLTAIPNRLGQFVVGVCVNEYRQGKFIGSTKRDFQFNVTICPPAPTASIPVQLVACGLTANLKSLSINASTYLWDFGDSTNISDTSTLENPSYTYPTTGKYKVSLIVNNNTICADTAFGDVLVYNAIKGANFSTSNVCLDKIAQFNDLSVLSEGTIQKWYWDFGDNNVAKINNPQHQFTQPDTFLVKLIVENENTCKDSIVKPIIVYPLPSTNAGPDTTVCFNQPFKLRASGASSYLWSGSGLSCYNCVNPKALANISEKYYLKGTSPFGCDFIDSVKITVPKVVSFAGSDTTICNKAEAFLYGSSPFTFRWFPSNSLNCSNCKNTIAKPSTTQTYYLEASDANGCKDTSSVIVKVRNPVTVNAGLDQNICYASTAILTGTGNIATKSWSPSRMVLCATCNPTSTVPLFQDTVFVLEVTDMNNCTNTDSIKIKVYTNSAFAGNDTTICYGSQVTLTGKGAITHRWKNLTSECAVCNQITVSPLDTTQYIYLSKDQYDCTNEDTVQVNVRRIIPNIEFTNNEPRCVDVPINFNGKVSNFDYLCLKKINYLWDFGDGTQDTIQNPTHQYLNSGDYTVTFDINGTKMPVKKLLRLLPIDSCLKNIYIPNTFTPNGDGQNDVLYVRGINVTKLLFRLYNNWGEEIFSTNNLQTGWDGTYKGSKLSPQVFVYTGFATFWDGSQVNLEGNVTLVE